jgi:hypothetical protein
MNGWCSTVARKGQDELNDRLDEIKALFCWSCFGLFQLVSVYSLSQNTIDSAETSRLLYQPNQPKGEG